MTSEIDKLKHFHVENYSGTNFTNDLNDGEDADNTDLLILSCNYSIQWKECSCLKGIRLEDVTVELEEEAYEEMRNNK